MKGLEASSGETTIGLVLGTLFKGRRFTAAGASLISEHAFHPLGFLPLFVARAARHYRLMHPTGMQMGRCIACGEEVPHGPGGCPLGPGVDRMPFPFEIEASDEPLAVTKLRATLSPHRACLVPALFMLQDVAIDLLEKSSHPRLIDATPLVDELEDYLNATISAQEELIRHETGGEVGDWRRAALAHLAVRPEAKEPAATGLQGGVSESLDGVVDVLSLFRDEPYEPTESPPAGESGAWR